MDSRLARRFLVALALVAFAGMLIAQAPARACLAADAAAQEEPINLTIGGLVAAEPIGDGLYDVQVEIGIELREEYSGGGVEVVLLAGGTVIGRRPLDIENFVPVGLYDCIKQSTASWFGSFCFCYYPVVVSFPGVEIPDGIPIEVRVDPNGSVSEVYEEDNTYLFYVNAPDPVTITFWHRFSERHNETLEQLATWFEEIYPNISVEWIYQGSYSALQQSINGAVVAGEVPTMTIFYEDWIPAVADALLPLEPLFTAYELADIVPGLVYKDLLTVPFNKSIMVLYYIEDYVPVPPTTWQEFYDLCVANTVDEDSDGQIDRYGTGLRPAANPEQFLTLLEQNNGTILNDDWTEVTLGNEAGVEALEFYASLAPYAWITSEYLNSNIGYVAMAIDTSAGFYYWDTAAQEAGLTVKAAPLPVGEKAASFIQGTNIGIFKDAPAEEIAAGLLFLKFLLEADNTAYWAVRTGYLPVTLSGLESTIWTDYVTANPEVVASSEMMPVGISSLPHPNYGDMRAALGTMCEEILLGAETVEDALATAVAEIESLLD